MFILLAEQREKLLTTVISRTSEFSLGDVLTAERKNREEELTRVCEGIATALCRGNEFDIMLATAPMVKNRAMMKKVAERLIIIARDACAGSASTALSGSENAAMLLEGSFDTAQLIEIKESMGIISERADKNANENLLITQFSSMLAVIGKKRRN